MQGIVKFSTYVKYRKSFLDNELQQRTTRTTDFFNIGGARRIFCRIRPTTKQRGSRKHESTKEKWEGSFRGFAVKVWSFQFSVLSVQLRN